MDLLKKSLTIGTCTAALSLIAACSSENTVGVNHDSDGFSVPVKDSLYGYELSYNHLLLSVLYYNAHLKNELNDNVEVYYGFSDDESSDFTKGACVGKFTDVCHMYNQMSDKFTRYFDPHFSEQIWQALLESEEEVGLGFDVKESGGALFITELYNEKLMIRVGDELVSIDGHAVSSKDDIYELLADYHNGETVELIVKRDGKNLRYYIVLDEYNVPTVHLSYEDSIPVIKIDQFAPNTSREDGTYGEFKIILQKVVDSGAKSAIIDLRNNPGGNTDHCNNVSSELLSKGDTIITDMATDVDSVLRRGRYEYVQKFDTITYTATTDGIGKDLYYVFLANEGSASCAELMLSAVTVNKKTPVVGLNSYGKGIGQSYVTTYAGGIAGITNLYSVDKNKDSFHGFGIAPDYVISDPDEQMAKAVQLAKEATELRTAGYGTVSTGNFDKVRPRGKDEFDIRQDAGRFKIIKFPK